MENPTFRDIEVGRSSRHTHERSQRQLADSAMRERRRVVVTTSVGVATLLIVADAVFGGPATGGGLVRTLGLVILLSALGLVISGASSAFRRVWDAALRPCIGRVFARCGELSLRWWRGPERQSSAQPGLAAGERVALIVGLILTTLDFALTILLLRDVFPEPPYVFTPFGLLSTELAG